MYLSNKYSQWYERIIDRARNRRAIDGYYETHHIIPRTMGGTDDPSNLVKLTAREHFICHLLLPMMTTGDSRHKMIYAHVIMSGRKTYGSRKYKFYREEYAVINGSLRSGAGNGMFGVDRSGEKNTFYGKNHTEESKQKNRLAHLGHSYTKGIRKTEEHKRALGVSARKRAKQYEFSHPEHGSFTGSLLDLHEKFPQPTLRKDCLWELATGRMKSYKKWQIEVCLLNHLQ